MKRYPKLKAYYYGGFGKPELIATSVTGLLKNVKVENNYLGDCTSEMRTIVNDYKKNLDLEQFKIEMEFYNIHINPTRQSLIETSEQWFGKNTPKHHFVDFSEDTETKRKNIINKLYSLQESGHFDDLPESFMEFEYCKDSELKYYKEILGI